MSESLGDRMKSTKAKILEIWYELPRDIQLDCEKYGVSDTPTKEEIYLWLLENK
jgi:hypothetical protein